MTSRMTATGFRYAVCSLRAKRAELAGEIASLQLQTRHRRRDLAKVDDMLGILAPGSDASQIPPKKAVKYLNVFRQGELGRAIIATLRAGGCPMTNLEIARAIFGHGGFADHLWTPIRRRTRANLAYLEVLGRVQKMGDGVNTLWQLV